MKLLLLIIGFLISLAVQLFFLQAWQLDGVTPNVVIGFILMSCLFVSTERILWFGVFAGMYFDLYSSRLFGFNIIFFISIILFCKLVLKIGESDYSWWKPAIVAGVAAVPQGLLLQLPTLLANQANAVILTSLTYGGLTVAVAVIWYLIIGQSFEIAEKIKLSSVVKR